MGSFVRWEMVGHLQCESKKMLLPPEVFWPLSKRMRVFKQNFTRLLYVHIYDKLQNFIQLSLNLTKVCHIKCITKWSFTFHYCTDFIAKDEWPPNSPDLNTLDYHVWGAMFKAVHKLHSKPKTIPELKSALQQIWDDLPQTTINKAINDFRKRLNACASASGGHFEHTIWSLYRHILTELCLLFQKKFDKMYVLTRCLSSNSKNSC